MISFIGNDLVCWKKLLFGNQIKFECSSKLVQTVNSTWTDLTFDMPHSHNGMTNAPAQFCGLLKLWDFRSLSLLCHFHHFLPASPAFKHSAPSPLLHPPAGKAHVWYERSLSSHSSIFCSWNHSVKGRRNSGHQTHTRVCCCNLVFFFFFSFS